MKKNTLFQITFLAVAILISNSAASLVQADEPPPVSWVTQIGGPNTDQAYDVATDLQGNVLMVGRFIGTVDFNPGLGEDIQTSHNFNHCSYCLDAFVTKFNADGSYAWTRVIGGDLQDFGTSVAVDSAGNVYVAGEFTGTVDFDPSEAGVDSRTANGPFGRYDIFVTKFNSSGNYLWTRTIGGNSDEGRPSIAVDQSGSVVIAGSFRSTVDFDPGPNQNIHTSVSCGSNPNFFCPDIFVTKYDTNGNYLWAETIGGNNFDEPHDVAVDASGNILVAGIFAGGDIDFDPTPGDVDLHSSTFYSDEYTSVYWQDIFVTKLRPDGSYLWTRTTRWTDPVENTGRGINVNGIATDRSGNVFLVGNFSAMVDFNPADEEVDYKTANGGRDVFVMKFGVNGNYTWTSQLGNEYGDVGNAVATDSNGDPIVTGFLDFLYPAPDPLYGHLFVSKLHSNDGSVAWMYQAEGVTPNWGQAISVDPFQNILVAGKFNGTVLFDPPDGTFQFTAGGDYDAFVMRLGNYLPRFTLDIRIVGSGIVKKYPDQQLYADGQVVHLKAIPKFGWRFYKWGGDFSGNQNPTQMTITGNTSITAYFIQKASCTSSHPCS